MPSQLKIKKIEYSLNEGETWKILRDTISVPETVDVLFKVTVENTGDETAIGYVTWHNNDLLSKGLYIVASAYKDVDIEPGNTDIVQFLAVDAFAHSIWDAFCICTKSNANYPDTEADDVFEFYRQSPTPPGGPLACPIAVVCYGTPLIDSLGPIREFRDNFLRKYRIGRWFIHRYYNRLAPLLSPFLIKHRTAKLFGRKLVIGLIKMFRRYE